MTIEDDPLLKRAEAALAEMSRLYDAHLRFREKVDRQLERMRQIGMELDSRLPHPPEEPQAVRALLAGEES